MKNRIIKVSFGFLFIALLIFAEYRFIMTNICLYFGTGNTVYIEVFGQVEEYEVELWEKQ